MQAQKRVLLLIVIMAVITLGMETLAISLLYVTAVDEERARLIETARSQARLMEAVARFDARHNQGYPMGSGEATLSQILDAHKRYAAVGRTGEFTIARKEGSHIVFLLAHRGHMDYRVKPVAWDSTLAQPMHRALSGQSGSMTGLDYKGERVLAAYEPVAVLNLGIVAKINLEEVRAPFVRIGMYCALFGIIAVLIGAGLFMRITNPVLKKLENTVADLNTAMLKVKQLSGLLPICSECKRIRDEEGGWKRIEEYISTHSEADFTHGICPECSRKLYPEFYPGKKEK